jgi:hypothetical protein
MPSHAAENQVVSTSISAYYGQIRVAGWHLTPRAGQCTLLLISGSKVRVLVRPPRKINHLAWSKNGTDWAVCNFGTQAALMHSASKAMIALEAPGSVVCSKAVDGYSKFLFPETDSVVTAQPPGADSAEHAGHHRPT